MSMVNKQCSFSRAYASHRRYVLQCLLRRGVSSRDAEDLAQEVFIIAFRRFPDLYDGDRARLCLAGIAKNCAWSWYRAGRRRTRKHRAYAESLAIECSASVSPERKWAWVVVANWMSTTQDLRVMAWILVEWLGMTTREAGERTKTNPNTVRSRVRAFCSYVVQRQGWIQMFNGKRPTKVMGVRGASYSSNRMLLSQKSRWPSQVTN